MTARARGVAVIPDAFAIMGVDPGGKSGVCEGAFTNRGTAKQTLRRAARKNAVRCCVLDGPPEEQAHFLARFWRDFKFKMVVEWGIPEPYVLLAIEDFQLRQMAVDLAPVEVTSGLRTLQHVPVTQGWFDDVRPECLFRPSASESKSYATNERLKLWGLWEVTRGRGYGDHARDATRQVCLGVSKVLDGKWPGEVKS